MARRSAYLSVFPPRLAVLVHSISMAKLHWILLTLYLAVAAGYGGWRGQDLWSDWGIWCFLIPPIVWALSIAFRDWRRNWMGWTSIKIALVMGGAGVVGLGGGAVCIAWSIAAATPRWSNQPAARASVGAGFVIMATVLAFLNARFRKIAHPPEADHETNHPK